MNRNIINYGGGGSSVNSDYIINNIIVNTNTNNISNYLNNLNFTFLIALYTSG